MAAVADIHSAANAWCGEFGDRTWVARALSPCWYETGAAALLLALAIPVLVASALRIASYERRVAAGLETPCRKRGMTGGEAGFIGVALVLASLHVAHVIVSLVLPELRALPFHLAYEGAMAVLWLATVAASWRASARCHVPIDLRILVVSAATIYLGAVYIYFSVYLGGVFVYPPIYLKSVIWTAMMQTMFTVLLAVLEFKKPRAGLDGYTAIPADEEAGARAADGEERTWVALFVQACAFVWPKDDAALQMRVFACVVLLLAMRVLNVAVPVFYKKLVDRLAAAASSPAATRPSFLDLLKPWELLYLGAIFFQGGGGGGITGFINNARTYLWIPVSQDAYRRISLSVFSHVLNLDLNFHLARKTGEVTKVIDRGTNSMQNVLSTVLFSIAPQVFDMLAAATYLAGALEPWIALIVFVTIGSYLPLTIIVTEWRGSFRRAMNLTDNAKSAKVTDALLNYETVKYFTNEPLEQRQFADSIAAYQKAEYAFTASLNLLNVVQSAIMFTGMATGILVCTAGVAKGTLTVGDVVLFLTMMAQLYGPLNFFDMENLFQLLDKQGKVRDAPDAKALVLSEGRVAFDDVMFGYEAGATVLKNVSFCVPGGQTIAFVGPTGSGKSTLTRLLFRFYDVLSGSVTVDGQDVRSVTQRSLRSVVGMVPQDCVLFNDTIRYNIRYGRTDASDEEVEAAAQAASIHDAIMTRFPKKYDTIVGERGLRLSGGEKQRVAFARAILKNPPILVLDEATSALDTITEKNIQAALRDSRQQRTTLIVAHRLSTIADADIIVVLRDGVVEEIGAHGQLLEADGLYATMWNRQAQMGAGSNVDGLLSASARGSAASLTSLNAGAHAVNGGVGSQGNNGSANGDGSSAGGNHAHAR